MGWPKKARLGEKPLAGSINQSESIRNHLHSFTKKFILNAVFNKINFKTKIFRNKI